MLETVAMRCSPTDLHPAIVTINALAMVTAVETTWKFAVGLSVTGYFFFLRSPPPPPRAPVPLPPTFGFVKYFLLAVLSLCVTYFSYREIWSFCVYYYYS